ncbi:hypothetical protein GCM10010965_23540 [Caldalkalibacillus thermarum]|uniref:hypothetical protein n=1 Tax=Caldalkalibacillus thermarum TaxID=296745 RepID=UPI00166D8B73|nr:hypothetical protein [Caldalkalibacillus thermarum]GGK29983.1 hypothetical protein GCM10010965_23540 [Caldalkalibacillus thermarum]
MECYVTSCSFTDQPFLLEQDKEFVLKFNLDYPGEVVLDLVASVPEGDWGTKGKESAFVTIYLNEEYNQDLILFYGAENFSYQRLLGRLDAGQHVVRLTFQKDKSSPNIKCISIKKAEIRQVRDTDPEIIFYKYAPIIYGRNLSDDYESVYTDTPLALYYYCDQHENLSMTVEYQIIFSHEDEGTPGPALMSRWGRTTDIEWVYRVKLDKYGKRIQGSEKVEEFQGPEHMTTNFKGKYALGEHPILQAATKNGNVSDHITSSYRFLLKPTLCHSRDVNREEVMNLHPWTYRVSAKEIQRQQNLEYPVNPQTPHLADKRFYLYIHSSKQSFKGEHRYGSAGFKVKLRNHHTWYSSTHDNHSFAYDGADGPFATTVKLPEGTKIGDIEEIVAYYVEFQSAPADYYIQVNGIRSAFLLNEEYLPKRPFIISKNVAILSPQQREVSLWRADDLESGT